MDGFFAGAVAVTAIFVGARWALRVRRALEILELEAELELVEHASMHAHSSIAASA